MTISEKLTDQNIIDELEIQNKNKSDHQRYADNASKLITLLKAEQEKRKPESEKEWEWVEVENPTINFSVHSPFVSSGTVSLSEAIYNIRGTIYRCLYALGSDVTSVYIKTWK